jgi:hypothetical protein
MRFVKGRKRKKGTEDESRDSYCQLPESVLCCALRYELQVHVPTSICDSLAKRWQLALSDRTFSCKCCYLAATLSATTYAAKLQVTAS